MGLAVMVVTFIPQMNLLIRRGADWQGSYALIDYDELAYSAYVHSLIEGRPRLNNPYAGTEQGAENFYSIQFLPPYAIALSSQVLRISASTAFILLLPLAAFASSLAVFWLLSEVTGNYRAAAVGVLIVLLCGRLVSESPFEGMQSYAGFAFLRRYIPAVPFPFLLHILRVHMASLHAAIETCPGVVSCGGNNSWPTGVFIFLSLDCGGCMVLLFQLFVVRGPPWPASSRRHLHLYCCRHISVRIIPVLLPALTSSKGDGQCAGIGLYTRARFFPHN